MQVNFIGRLGGDVDLIEIKGRAAAKLRVAEDVGWGDKKTTTWHDVLVFRGAEKLPKLVSKGCRVLVRGDCVPSLWETNNGEVRLQVQTTGEVTVIDYAENGDEAKDGAGPTGGRRRRG